MHPPEGVDAASVFNDDMPDGLDKSMGLRFVEATPQRLVATIPIAGNTQPFGLWHGGASCVVAETMGSMGAALHAGPGARVVGIEINASHHRSATSGTLTAVATPLHLGRTLATYEVVLSDDEGRRLCTARISCAIRRD